MSAGLSVCLSVAQSTCSVYIFMSLCRSLCLCQSVCLLVLFSDCLSVSRSVHLFVCLSVSSICFQVGQIDRQPDSLVICILSICLSICLSVCVVFFPCSVCLTVYIIRLVVCPLCQSVSMSVCLNV